MTSFAEARNRSPPLDPSIEGSDRRVGPHELAVRWTPKREISPCTRVRARTLSVREETVDSDADLAAFGLELEPLQLRDLRTLWLY